MGREAGGWLRTGRGRSLQPTRPTRRPAPASSVDESGRSAGARRAESGVRRLPPPPPPPPPQPPVPPRTPEQEFWDEDPEPPAAAPPPPQPSRPRNVPNGAARSAVGLRRRPSGRLIAAIAAGLLAVLAIWFLIALFQPFHGDGSAGSWSRIPKGASVSEVGDLLDDEGVISSSTLFQIRVTLAGKRSNLYPGRFALAHDMSLRRRRSTRSRPAAGEDGRHGDDPRGLQPRSRRRRWSKKPALAGSYMKATRPARSTSTPPTTAASGAKNLEGFLFPDTFELKPGAPVADLVQLQLQDFKRRIKGVDMNYAKSKNLTVYDVRHDRLDGPGRVRRARAGPAWSPR